MVESGIPIGPLSKAKVPLRMSLRTPPCLASIKSSSSLGYVLLMCPCQCLLINVAHRTLFNTDSETYMATSRKIWETFHGTASRALNLTHLKSTYLATRLL